MIVARIVLIAGKLAVFAERNHMKPVAVSVEVVFGKILIPFDAILSAEIVGFLPSFGLDTNELDVAGVGGFFEEGMAKLV